MERSRPVQVGDLVEVTVDDLTTKHTIYQIIGSTIYLSEDYNEFIYSIESQGQDVWMASWLEDVAHTIEFTSREELEEELEGQIEGRVEERISFTGNEYLDKEILRQVPIEDFESVRSTNLKINEWCEEVLRDLLLEDDPKLVEMKPDDMKFSEWFKIIEGGVRSAISNNQLELVRYYIETNQVNPETVAIIAATTNSQGSHRILEFILENHMSIGIGPIAMNYAIKHGNTHILDILADDDILPTGLALFDSILNGHFNVADWWRREHIDYTHFQAEYEISLSRRHNSLEAVKLIYENFGLLPDVNQVALRGEEDILEWLAEMNIFPSPTTS